MNYTFTCTDKNVALYGKNVVLHGNVIFVQ